MLAHPVDMREDAPVLIRSGQTSGFAGDLVEFYSPGSVESLNFGDLPATPL